MVYGNLRNDRSHVKKCKLNQRKLSRVGAERAIIHALLENRRLQNFALLSVGLVSVGTVLYFLRSILAPFAMAVFAKILLDPAIEGMKKKGLPRPLAIAVTFLVSAVVVTGVAGIVAGSIGQLTDHVD